MSFAERWATPRPPLPVAVAVTVLLLGWIAATINSLFGDLGSMVQGLFSTVILAVLMAGLWRGHRSVWILTLIVGALNAAAGLVGWLGLTERIDDGITAPLRLAVAVLVVALVTVPSDARAYFRRGRRPTGQAS